MPNEISEDEIIKLLSEPIPVVTYSDEKFNFTRFKNGIYSFEIIGQKGRKGKLEQMVYISNETFNSLKNKCFGENGKLRNDEDTLKEVHSLLRGRDADSKNGRVLYSYWKDSNLKFGYSGKIISIDKPEL